MSNTAGSSALQSKRLIAHGGPEAYSAKASGYFAGAQANYVAELPQNPEARILEIGCGDGATGALALSQGKCGAYHGVELFHKAAELAKSRITEVLVGDIEHQDLPWPTMYFDALILSEVLEHLADPWATLLRIRPLLKANALVFASSPNVSHHRVIRMLLRGSWDLTEFGVMDRTHLRWFTPKSYRDLFESCGYVVDSAREKEPLGRKAKAISFLTLGRFRHLFARQIDLRGHC
jgi:2-polyprenyl-3-methyl-5-hydroxy-6-metoxy-1,4-benzoquinol methylase